MCLWRSSYWSKSPGFGKQLYQKGNSLTSISQGTHSLLRSTYYSKEHLSVSASHDICTIKIYYFIVILTFALGYLFSQDLIILVICAYTALAHFSIPCFKYFCGLNMNRKWITNFWSKRSKTFCAEFVIIWSGDSEIILVLRSFRS